MKNSVKKSVNVLQKLYMGGLVPYPRVSNDFEITPYFELFPHPPLPIINGINEPIQKRDTKVDKKHSLLTLSLVKLVQPSTAFKTAEKIDDFLDEELNYINIEKEQIFKKIIACFDEIIEKEKLEAEEVMKIANSVYSESNKQVVNNSLSLYALENVSFTKDKKDRKKNLYLFAKRKNKNNLTISENINDLEINKVYKNLEDFISDYKNSKNNLNMEIANESNINK